MAVDLPPDRDLTLIFERDDVREALAGHCASTHDDDSESIARCRYCSLLCAIIGAAVTEWKVICDTQPSLGKDRLDG